MPLYYVLEYSLPAVTQSYAVRVSLEFVLCFAGLAIVSEGLRRAVNLRALRDRLIALIDRRTRATRAPASSTAASHGR